MNIDIREFTLVNGVLDEYALFINGRQMLAGTWEHLNSVQNALEGGPKCKCTTDAARKDAAKVLRKLRKLEKAAQAASDLRGIWADIPPEAMGDLLKDD
jgi:hypothetical protein